MHRILLEPAYLRWLQQQIDYKSLNYELLRQCLDILKQLTKQSSCFEAIQFVQIDRRLIRIALQHAEDEFPTQMIADSLQILRNLINITPYRYLYKIVF